jgi:hypothetical protein
LWGWVVLLTVVVWLILILALLARRIRGLGRGTRIDERIWSCDG